MTRWNRLEDSELDAQTIYVGAYGWRDNDALGRIWARTPKQFAAYMSKTLRQEARNAWDADWGNGRTLTSYQDDLWYVGPFAQTVGETVADLDEPDRADEFRDDVRTMPAWVSY